MSTRAILLGITFSLLWSSAFTAARYLMLSLPPLTTSALRFFLAGLIAIAIARYLGQPLPAGRTQWRAIALFGVCQNTLYLGFFFLAMQRVDASIAAIMGSSLPLVVAALSLLLRRERLPGLGYIGLFVGFFGVALILGSRISSTTVDSLGLAYGAIGVSALAVATLTLQSASRGNDLLMVVGLQMLIGAAALLPPAYLLEDWTLHWTPSLAATFIYIMLGPGILATLIWFQLVKLTGATRAAAFHFLTPFFGVTIAAAVLGEPLSWLDLVGVTIVMAGILAVQISRNQRRAGL